MKPIETFGRRRYEPKLSDGDVPEEAESLLNTASLMEQTWMENMPRSAVNAIERGNAQALEESVSGNSAFGEVGKDSGGRMGPSKVASYGRVSLADDNSITNREELIMSLYDVHDELINVFEKVPDSDSSTLDEICNSINKIGNCIADLGGKVEKFSAIDHVSGLAAPSLDNMSEKVIETTKKLYTRANIEQAFEKDKAIIIVFAGEENGILYRTAGKITPRYCWNGNEALDYIYSSGAGKMSVKVFENGKWADKSDNYEITWNVPAELNIAKASAEDVNKFRKIAKKSPSKAEEATSEESTLDEDIDMNFEISEKNS